MNVFKPSILKQLVTVSLVAVALSFGYTSSAGERGLGKAMKYWDSGYQKEKAGDREGAIADYSRAIKADPEYAMGYSSRAHERFKTGDYDGAIADATKCLELQANDLSCYMTRGMAYKGKGDLAHADSDEKKVSAIMNEYTSREAASRSSAKHYTDGQPIPGVGTAIGSVYILPNGGCFGDPGAGIHWASGARMYFGDTVSAQNPILLVQPGSPATK